MSSNNIKTNRNLPRKLFELSLFSAIILFSGKFAFASDITPDNLENLVNKERTMRGLPALSVNDDLNRAANLKSKDMINRDYFEHFAYDLAPWDFISMAGYDYLYAGENLAMDFNSAEGMVSAWMESQAHRDNILNPDFSEIGIGVIKGEFSNNTSEHETIMVSNMFGTKKPAIVKIFNSIAKSISSIF